MRTPVVVLAIVSLIATVAHAQDKRTVAVEGKAETKVAPDLATLKFGIVAKNREMMVAKDKVDASVVGVVKAISECGLNQAGIRRSKINITTEFEERDVGATNPLHVVQRDVEAECSVKQIDAVLRAATKAGVNHIYGISYSLANDADIRQKTLAAAIRNAKEQASFLAESFDAKVGKALKIQGDDKFYPANLSLVTSTAQDPFDDSTYVPDTITITRTVNVVFELVD